MASQFAKRHAAIIADLIMQYIESEESGLSQTLLDDDVGEADEKCTELIYAIGCLMPTVIYMKLTDEKINAFDFNHLANKLIFKYLERQKQP